VRIDLSKEHPLIPTGNSCRFCDPNLDGILFQNNLAIIVWDKHPASIGHALVIPKRHVESYLELTAAEIIAMHDLLTEAVLYLNQLHAPAGYNMGINEGVAAGRTIHHVHMHIIPRYEGDVKDPRGGLRLLVPQDNQEE
jgi:diadenosine tetraphosphate (Ap4A) HIT family hydrolase